LSNYSILDHNIMDGLWAHTDDPEVHERACSAFLRLRARSLIGAEAVANRIARCGTVLAPLLKASARLHDVEVPPDLPRYIEERVVRLTFPGN